MPVQTGFFDLFVVPSSYINTIENINEDDDVDTEAGLIRNEGAKQAGLATIALEPMESRTGETFYIYPRGEDILVQVVVGNTTFEFPFHCRKRRIP